MSNVHVVDPEQSYSSAAVNAFLAEVREFGVDVHAGERTEIGNLKVLTAVMQRIRQVEARLDVLEQARP